MLEDNYPELLIDVDKFTLGNVRNLKDYEKLIDFNFMSEKKNIVIIIYNFIFFLSDFSYYKIFFADS